MQRSWGGKELGTFQALTEKQCGWSTAGQKKERHEVTLTNKERDSCAGPRRPWFQFGLSSESFVFEGF